MNYQPKPYNTSEIQLSQELMELAEEMAKNVHETWAKARIDEGWKYGPQRDDIHKLHPCLVPYEDLPEIEKEYDRRTSLETLKFIISRGFQINVKG